MRFAKFLLCIALCVLIASCSFSGPDLGQDDDKPGYEEPTTAELSTLSFDVDSITTIAPYSYSSGASTGSVKAYEMDGDSYLSYIGPDTIGFEPLVFQTDNGTKVVFYRTQIADAGDGYYIANIDNLQTIKKEPEVRYRETGELDEEGNPIMEAYTVIVDVSRYYGFNLAVMDANTGNVYLLMEPESYNGPYINPYNEDWADNIYSSEDAIFLLAERMSDGNTYGAYTIYRIEKDKLDGGVVKAVTNDSYIKYPQNLIVADNAVLFQDWQTSDDPLVVDLENDMPPMAVDFSKFSQQIDFRGDGYPEPVSPSYDNLYFVGDTLHSIEVRYGRAFDFSMSIDQGEVILDSFNEIETPIKNNEFSGRLLYSRSTSEEAEAVFLLQRKYNEFAFLRVRYNGKGEIASMSAVEVSNGRLDEESVPYLQYNGSRIYWISGANKISSSICYADLNSGIVNSFPVQGKTIASRELAVDESGTVTYWQYLSGTDVGTFQWNPDRGGEPELLLLQKGDLHQIINLDTLL